MLYQGTCRKQDFVQELVEVITSDGNFNMVSSNITKDFNTVSDGFVFRSNYINQGENITFAIKDFTNGNLNVKTEIRIMHGNKYVPNAVTGVNGTWANKSSWKTWNITKEGIVSHDTVIKYWIDILPHRIIIITQKDHYGFEYPAFLYIGSPEPTSQVSTHLMNNSLIMASNLQHFQPTNANNFVEVLRDADGMYFQNQLLNTLLPTTNPNIAGEYQLSPIYVGNSNTGFIGKIDGIWSLPNMGINNNDEIEVDGARYKVFSVPPQHGFSSIQNISNFIAIKVV